MGAIGTVDEKLIASTKALFEKRCIVLLEWACRTLRNSKPIDTEWGEENITANVYDLIYYSQLAIDYDIHPECEHLFYDQAILDNKKKAKAAPRIDMVFQNNWSGRRFLFFVEAKILVENDFKKKGRKRKTLAASVIKRYIETGIDHYLSGHYPPGCLLGYVLNGTINGVVNALNDQLQNATRGGECMYYISGFIPWVCFRSDHATQGMHIEHFLFDMH